MDKNTQVLFEQYLTIIENLTDTAKMIAQVEEEKAVAVSYRRHELLEHFTRREQALILKLRGQDQHRRKLTKAFGWENLTFSQILEKSDPDQRTDLTPRFRDLEQQLRRLKESKEIAGQVIHVRVYELLIALRQEEGVPYDDTRNVCLDRFPQAKLIDRYV